MYSPKSRNSSISLKPTSIKHNDTAFQPIHESHIFRSRSRSQIPKLGTSQAKEPALEQHHTEPSDIKANETHNKQETLVFKVMNKLSLSLDNTGSVARDHMANERTFLAWMRTALGYMTLCIGILHFYRMEIKSTKIDVNGVIYDLPRDEKSRLIERLGKPIGIICSLIALISIFIGAVRYYQVQTLLIKNEYPATRITITMLIVINVAIVLLLLALNIKIVV